MADHYAEHTLIFHRDGKRVRLPAGQVHKLSAAEAKDIQKVNPDAIRKPQNESDAGTDLRTGTMQGGGDGGTGDKRNHVKQENESDEQFRRRTEGEIEGRGAGAGETPLQADEGDDPDLDV